MYGGCSVTNTVFVDVCCTVASHDESPAPVKLKKWLKTPIAEQDGGANATATAQPQVNTPFDTANTGNPGTYKS